MATETTQAPTRGYTATKDQLLKRLRRIEGQVRGVQGMVAEPSDQADKTDELMAAFARVLRRG
jgi:DNA-binding FrmR family transcriptional regulator